MRVVSAVAQNVRQLHDVPAKTVKCAGKEVAQIVGEHPGGRHTGGAAQPLHLRPDLGPG